VQDVASTFAFNPIKAAEYDPGAAVAPPEGASVKPADPIVGASTVSELNASEKVGSGSPTVGQNRTVGPADGDAIEVDVSREAAPAVLYDALILPDGGPAVDTLRADGRTLEFIKDQYRHCTPILALGASAQLAEGLWHRDGVAQSTIRSGIDRVVRREHGRRRLRRCDSEAPAFRQRKGSATHLMCASRPTSS
jgi:hypothetical protein